ncbi:hypothetical protein N0V95_009433 [Ascochyta clinopodiicola]|nr:hypothetical protein N0V95_009433 [Ascochyta clinopodiicola]
MPSSEENLLQTCYWFMTQAEEIKSHWTRTVNGHNEETQVLLQDIRDFVVAVFEYTNLPNGNLKKPSKTESNAWLMLRAHELKAHIDAQQATSDQKTQSLINYANNSILATTKTLAACAPVLSTLNLEATDSELTNRH